MFTEFSIRFTDPSKRLGPNRLPSLGGGVGGEVLVQVPNIIDQSYFSSPFMPLLELGGSTVQPLALGRQ
eukprot:5720268-Karenia_brevis.AAC.1